MAVEFKAGLKDVIAVNSSICTVDGEAGKLYYRGYSITALARYATYEEIVHLLWQGDLPTRTQLESLSAELAQARPLPDPVVASMRTYPKTAHALEALRTAVSVVGLYDPDAHSTAPDATLRKAVRLTAQIPVMVGSWHHLRQGREPVRPRTEGPTAENFLYVLTGKPPSPVAAPTMDMIFILPADHEIHASTLATRGAIATFADLVYYALGIPIDLCTSIFASARISGWCAHAMEQYHDRLIRPRAHYTGPPPRAFVPLAERR